MKKNAVQWTWFYTATAVMGMLAIIIFRLAESWSQAHMGRYDHWLYTILFSIGFIYTIRSMMHPRGDKKVVKIIWTIRRRHWDAVTGALFALVGVLGVNSQVDWIAFAHLPATGLAIFFAHVGMIAYYRPGSVGFNGALAGSAVTIFLFILSLRGIVLNVAEGEGMVSIPILIYILSTTKIE